jgi:hypothetical protein
MKVTLRLTEAYGGHVARAVDVREGTDIEEVLPKMERNGGISGLALWNSCLGRVVGGYLSEGKLEEGRTYNLRSTDSDKTRAFLQREAPIFLN